MKLRSFLLAALLVCGAPPSTAADADLAARACAALHTLPAERRQACCGGAAENLAAVCASALRAALERGAVRVDAGRVARCARDTRKSLSGCDWVSPLLPEPAPSCATLIDGTLARGAPCASSLECADGLYCRGAAPGVGGVCAPPARVGAACENPADNLAAFARGVGDPRHPSCEGLCMRGQCVARGAEGAACPSSALCAGGLHCIDGTCRARALPVAGEPCSAQKECGAGLVCTVGTCGPPKAGGASCKLPFECRSLACEKAPGAKRGTCAAVCPAATGNAGLP
jgi:hypothetical protein